MTAPTVDTDRATVLARALQEAAEDVVIYLAKTPTAKADASAGSEYQQLAARREAALVAVVDAIRGGAS